MKEIKALRGYSRALFEIAAETARENRYLEELENFFSCVTPELLAFSANPAFAYEEKKQVMAEVCSRCKLDREVTAFVLLLTQHRRLGLLDEIIDYYRSLLLTSQGKKLVKLCSATPLQAKEREQLQRAVAGWVKGDLQFEEHVKPELIGGVQVQVGSKVWDGSVRGRLQRLKTALLSV